MENRKQPRANLTFQVQFSIQKGQVYIDGELSDLSATGCRIVSNLFIPPVGTNIELCIYPSNDAIPLVIDKANVQWIEQNEMGIMFSEIRPETLKRIKEVCRKLKW